MSIADETRFARHHGSLDDDAYTAQVARCRFLLEEWVSATGLDRWHIHTVWHRGGDWKDSEQSLFTCAWQWTYNLATIHANLPLIAERSDAEVERAIVHELAHCWTSELADQRKASDFADHDEHATQAIADALMRVRTWKSP